MTAHPSHILWTEKYRPTTFDSFVFSTSAVADTFAGFKQEGAFPHLLLSGPPGCGKTTMARVLMNELAIPPQDIVQINCSDERGIDMFRNKIKSIVGLVSIGPFRVIHMEESDALTTDAQEALRIFMEDQSSNVRFIFTCNAPLKLTDRLRSRCMHIPMVSPPTRKLLQRAVAILDEQDITYADEDLLDIIRASAGDMRQVITQLQSRSASGSLLPTGLRVSSPGGSVDSFLILLKDGDWRAIANAAAGLAERSGWEYVYETLYTNLESFVPSTMHDEAVVVIAEHLYRHTTIANPTIGMAACVIQLLQLRSE